MAIEMQSAEVKDPKTQIHTRAAVHKERGEASAAILISLMSFLLSRPQLNLCI